MHEGPIASTEMSDQKPSSHNIVRMYFIIKNSIV